jgi:hypothetical protein
MALALGVRTPLDLDSEIRRTLYRIEGIAPEYLGGRRPWEDMTGTSRAGREDEAGTSSGGEADEAGMWATIHEDGRFPSLADLFLHHGGSLEMVEELIQGIKERTKEELEHWGLGKVRLRCSMSPDEPNIVMDDNKEAEKWEHLEELRLWMKHVVGLMSDIVNNSLGQAFFVWTPPFSSF